jgi:type II secretory pathway pseudopilin PulG
MQKRFRGFALIELVIALAVLMVALAAYLNYQRNQALDALRAQAILDYAADLRTLDRAFRSYAASKSATVADGNTVVVAVGDLINASFLPNGFATRNGSGGTSPLGSTYAMVMSKDATDHKMRGVLWETGSPLAQRLEILGYPSDASGIASLKSQVAAKLAGEGAVAATIPGGTQTANSGGSNGWTKTLTTWVNTPPTYASAAILIGFPDLDPVGVLPNGNGAKKYTNCKLQFATCAVNYIQPYCDAANAQTPTCTTGKVSAGLIPHCAYRQTDTTTTDVGTFTFGSRQTIVLSRQDPNTNYKCDPLRNPQCGAAPYDIRNNTYTYGYVTLNNAEIGQQQLCRVDFTRTDPFSSYFPPPVESSYYEWPNTASDNVCCDPG